MLGGLDVTMKGKGKLICRIGNVALLMEDHGQGEIYRLCILHPNSNEIATAVFMNMEDAVWLVKCWDNCINTIMGHNVQENWYGDKASEGCEEE